MSETLFNPLAQIIKTNKCIEKEITDMCHGKKRDNFDMAFFSNSMTQK